MKKYSKKWMQGFVEGNLPTDDNFILDEVSKKGFEVEGFEKSSDGDSLFEIKVLPNRIADAFSVRGMGREFAAVFNLKWGGEIPKLDLNNFKLNNDFIINQNKSNQENIPVRIFTGIKVKNFDNTIVTPGWIKDIIEKSGGRSINCLVDITNLMLFSFGQPAHVFDADKLTGKIVLRFATEGEELELLDGKKVKLSAQDFVIADESKALSLGGIKGGKASETTKNTKNCFFEMANFDPIMIRKTSQRLINRTDASKIFENGISTNKTEDALGILIATIKEIQPSCEIEFIVSNKWQEIGQNWVNTTCTDIRNFGGVNISNEEIVKLLHAQNFEVKLENDNLKVKATGERLDVNIPEDVAEEVLRLYGFDNIADKSLHLKSTTAHDPMFLLENYLRVKLFERGFTEIETYVFVDKGEVKLKAGLAEDKMFLRDNLTAGMLEAYKKNYNYLPLIEKTEVKTYEMGNVFTNNGEDRRLCVLWEDGKKKSKFAENIQSEITGILKEIYLKENFDLKDVFVSEKPACIEWSLTNILKILEEKDIAIPFLKVEQDLGDIKYKPLSIYPFIVRDIAMFVPSGFDFENLKKAILKLNLANVEKVYMFDSFTKKDEQGVEKTSIAFRIIFQSNEKTLTDVEIELEMNKVNNYLKENNFEIR